MAESYGIWNFLQAVEIHYDDLSRSEGKQKDLLFKKDSVNWDGSHGNEK